LSSKDAGDIFPNEPLGFKEFNKSKGDEGQVTTRVIQALSESGCAECLAGASCANNVNCSGDESPFFPSSDVAIVGCVGKTMLEDGAGERLDFREADRLPSEVFPSYARGLDAAKERKVFQGSRGHRWLGKRK
jgi:hypothetical protein